MFRTSNRLVRGWRGKVRWKWVSRCWGRSSTDTSSGNRRTVDIPRGGEGVYRAPEQLLILTDPGLRIPEDEARIPQWTFPRRRPRKTTHLTLLRIARFGEIPERTCCQRTIPISHTVYWAHSVFERWQFLSLFRGETLCGRNCVTLEIEIAQGPVRSKRFPKHC